ncbi:MAG: hypothetical protein VCD33_01815 [Alphaproteobacteria bacterium]
MERLRAEGLTVEEGSAGMPTAFCATWCADGGEDGPVIGSYAEYDAVPGNSQQAVPYQAPREGVHRWAAGHTDPHSGLGIGALGGFAPVIDPMVFSASRCIGATIIDLLTDTTGIDRAQAEFKERTGGGVGGSKWVAPLLPSDLEAPIHYRWPEYVSTIRGDEWWIPEGA